MAFFGNKVSIRPYFLSNFCVYAIASPYCHCFRKHLIVPLECCRFLFLYIFFFLLLRVLRPLFSITQCSSIWFERHICAQFLTCTWKLIAWVARISFCVQTLYLRIILIYPVAFYSTAGVRECVDEWVCFFSMSSYFFLLWFRFDFFSFIVVYFRFACLFTVLFLLCFLLLLLFFFFVRLNAVCNIRSCLQAFHFRDDIALVIILSRMHDCVQKTSSMNWLQTFIETENY